MKETIIMVHGMMGGAWYWANYKNFFEEKGCDCVVPTLRYHNVDPNSEPNPNLGTVGVLDYVRDIEGEIERLENLGKIENPPILVGHSMGGLIVLLVTSRGIISTKAAVLITPAPPYGIFSLKFSPIKTFSNVMKVGGWWRKPFRLSYEKFSYSILNLLPESERRDTYQKFVYESGRALFQIGLWFLDREKSTKVDYKNINCPVLIIAGKKDRITPSSAVRKIGKKIKNSTYKEFPNNAHWIIGEKGWEESAEFIYQWLQKVNQNHA